MEDHDYVYKMGSLILPGLVFLIVYPMTVGVVYLVTKFSKLELQMLILLYVITALGILGLWVFAKSKHVLIEDQVIIFKSILGEYTLEPADVRRVVFYWNAKGQEIAQIWTKRKTFYLSEFYFPFPELMSDLEGFIEENAIRTNLTGRVTG
ncbi:MAG: hypothetical protein WA131_06060 [Desulfitobacteriaceae bacterium]